MHPSQEVGSSQMFQFLQAGTKNSVLVVAAHPDDEVLGCGGTIARHAEAGDHVQVLIVAEGATSRLQKRDRGESSEELSALVRAAQKAGVILGASGVELLGCPDNRLDSLDRLDLIKCIEARMERYQPSVVYVHHAGDVNVDHRRLHEAVITACSQSLASRCDVCLVSRLPAVQNGNRQAQPQYFSLIVRRHLRTLIA